MSISVEVFNCLREKDSEPLVIQQCKFLEQVYKTNLTEVILQQEENFENRLTLRAVKDKLQAADRDHIWSLVSPHENLAALSRDISWMRLWDEARQQVLEFAAEVNLGDVIRGKVAPAVLVPAHRTGKSVNTGMVIITRRTVAIALAPQIPCSFSQPLARKLLKRHYHSGQYCTSCHIMSLVISHYFLSVCIPCGLYNEILNFEFCFPIY